MAYQNKLGRRFNNRMTLLKKSTNKRILVWVVQNTSSQESSPIKKLKQVSSHYLKLWYFFKSKMGPLAIHASRKLSLWPITINTVELLRKINLNFAARSVTNHLRIIAGSLSTWLATGIWEIYTKGKPILINHMP